MTTNFLAIVAALSMKETGNNDRAIGAHGELSRWQLMDYVRRDYPGRDWRNPAEVQPVVIAELTKRANHFIQTHHRWPTAAEYSLLWHCQNRVSRPTAGDRDYAQCVVNLAGRGL